MSTETVSGGGPEDLPSKIRDRKVSVSLVYGPGRGGRKAVVGVFAGLDDVDNENVAKYNFATTTSPMIALQQSLWRFRRDHPAIPLSSLRGNVHAKFRGRWGVMPIPNVVEYIRRHDQRLAEGDKAPSLALIR